MTGIQTVLLLQASQYARSGELIDPSRQPLHPCEYPSDESHESEAASLLDLGSSS